MLLCWASFCLRHLAECHSVMLFCWVSLCSHYNTKLCLLRVILLHFKLLDIIGCHFVESNVLSGILLSCWMSLYWVSFFECHFVEAIQLSVIWSYVILLTASFHYRECQSIECHSVKPHLAECHLAGCHSTECQGTQKQHQWQQKTRENELEQMVDIWSTKTLMKGRGSY